MLPKKIAPLGIRLGGVGTGSGHTSTVSPDGFAGFRVDSGTVGSGLSGGLEGFGNLSPNRMNVPRRIGSSALIMCLVTFAILITSLSEDRNIRGGRGLARGERGLELARVAAHPPILKAGARADDVAGRVHLELVDDVPARGARDPEAP